MPLGPRAEGRVQRIYVERGFGFIRCTGGAVAATDIGQDYFFHMSGLDEGSIALLEEGSLVTFEPRQVAKGRRAEHVQQRPELG